jgi:hypothetical protein
LRRNPISRRRNCFLMGALIESVIVLGKLEELAAGLNDQLSGVEIRDQPRKTTPPQVE